MGHYKLVPRGKSVWTMDIFICLNQVIFLQSFKSYEFLIHFSKLVHDFLRTFSGFSHNFVMTFSKLSQDLFSTFPSLCQGFIITFLWITRDFACHFYDFFITFSEILHDFLITFSGLSQKFLRQCSRHFFSSLGKTSAKVFGVLSQKWVILQILFHFLAFYDYLWRFMILYGTFMALYATFRHFWPGIRFVENLLFSQFMPYLGWNIFEQTMLV